MDSTRSAAPASCSAAEIIDAYAAFQEQVEGFTASGNWSGYADLFTEDAVYTEHAYGVLRGREEIRAWVTRTMTSFPGNVMPRFPLSWSVVDEPTGRLICEVDNPMPDPGDGTHHAAANITIMTYAGDGLFSAEEDVYNPMNFARMTVRWARIAEEHGRLPQDGKAYLEQWGHLVR